MLTWRERFLTLCGPGLLAGITLGDWCRLLRENGLGIDLPYLPRAILITVAAVVNSPFRWYETWRYARQWESMSIEPPLFVLGHWRSGTTHLHYLLGLDDRFACPNLYQVHYAHTFLTTERNFSGGTGFLLPRHRPFDNVRLDLTVPDEDEFAMCVSGFMTSYLTGVFPRRAEYYDQFLTFRDAPAEAVEVWKSSLRRLFQKLTLKHGKALIVKSPSHTGRLKLLLDMFPQAKFVHIHRDPYTVFQSFVHAHNTGLPFARLQRTDQFDWPERVIRQYQELHTAFFEERSLIPEDHFHELAFADLEKNPLDEMKRLYARLDLANFAHVEPNLRAYLASQSNYRKNTFNDLPPHLRSRIASEWKRCFEEWGYAV